jgi:hypothetical protein
MFRNPKNFEFLLTHLLNITQANHSKISGEQTSISTDFLAINLSIATNRILTIELGKSETSYFKFARSLSLKVSPSKGCTPVFGYLSSVGPKIRAIATEKY